MAKPLVLDAFLPYRLAVTAEAVSRALSAVYAERFELGIAEWRILANLGRLGSLTAGALANHSTLDKPKVTRALQRLKRRRLVTRQTGREDRREVTIALTAEGTRVYTEIAALAQAWQADLLAVLPMRERKSLLTMLETIETQARAMSA